MIKKALKNFDMFAASPLLRAKGEVEVTNICGGIFSLLIISYFIYMFINQSINTLSYEEIESIETVRISFDSNRQIDSPMFAVGIKFINLSADSQMFTVKAERRQIIDNRTIINTPIEMVPCTADMWSSIESFEEIFRIYSLSQKYCPKQTGIKLKGGLYGDFMRQVVVSINPCNNATSSVVCWPSSYLEITLDAYLSVYREMVGEMFILDTNINVNSKNPIYTYLNDQAFWLSFAYTRGAQCLIQFGQYEIITDTSFLPWESSQTQTGGFLEKAAALYIDRFNSSASSYNLVQKFVEVFFVTSAKKRFIQRRYGKIDDVLSYAGGLFGLIISFFSFFMMSFNEYRYEIMIGEGAFTSNFDKDSNLTHSQMTFLMYLKYTVYDWVKTFCCEKKLNWEDCKIIDQVRQEACCQVDVQLLLRRMNKVERLVGLKFSQEQQAIGSLAQSSSLQKIQKKRRIVQYSNKVMQNRKGLTMQSLQLVKRGFKFSSRNNTFIQLQDMEGMQEESFSQNNGESSKVFFPTKTESKEPQSLLLIRTYLMEQSDYLKQFETVELQEEDLEIEKQLTSYFLKLEQNARISLMKTIPLPILNRILSNGKQQNGAEKTHENFINVDKVIKIMPLIQ